MKRLSPFDRLVLAGTACGTVGFALIWFPMAFLFVAVVSFVLAVVIDMRTTSGDTMA